MKKVNLGIIGTGLASTIIHWPALKKMQNKFEIVQVNNHTKKKAQTFAKLVGNVPYTLDYKKLLANPEIDAVDIVLPIELNHKIVKEALDAGKHVFVEKPIALNLKEAKKMLKFPERYNKQVMMVAENYRYREVYQKAKSLLEQGAIGKPHFFNWNICTNVSVDNVFAETKWRKNHKYEGGFVTDAGVHNIATIRLLTGEIISATALTKNMNPKMGRTDTICLQFQTNKDVNGTLNMAFSSQGYSEDKLLIHGSNGTMEIAGDNISIHKEKKKPKLIKCNADFGIPGEFNDFYSAVTKGKKVTSTFEESYKDLEIILKVLKSPGRKVNFDH